MTISYSNLKAIKVLEPRTAIRENTKYLFKVPGNQVTFETFSSTSSSTSSTSYKCDPPSINSLVSRLAYQTIEFDVTFRFSAYDTNTNQLVGLGEQNDAGAIIAARKAIGFICGAGTSKNVGKSNFAVQNNGAAVAVDVNSLDVLVNPFYDVDAKPAICPRQFPLSSICRTQKITINGDVITNEPYKFIHPVARFNLDHMAMADSISPAQGDVYQYYEDDGTAKRYTQTLNNAANVETFLTSNLGGTRSPFASFGQSSYTQSRGSYAPKAIGVVNNTANYTSIVCTYEITEPIFISPMSSGDNNMMALSQIRNFDMYFSWDTGNIERLFSINLGIIQESAVAPANNKVNSGTVVISDVTFKQELSKMSFCYITNQINQEIPQTLVYDYHDWEVHDKDFTKALAAGASDTFSSDNITLSSIPNRIYIWMQRKIDDLTAIDSDAYMGIEGINIQFNNVAGVLSSAEQWDLYQMSKDCGYTDTYESFRYYGGSVLCLDFSKHLGLPPNLAPGILGNFGFKFQLTARNLLSEAINPSLYFIVDSVGTYTITNGGQIVKNIGILTPEDAVKDADIQREADYQVLEKLYGGSFLSGMKNLLPKAAAFKPYAKKAIKMGKELTPLLGLAPRAKNVADLGLSLADELLGEGYTKAQVNKMMREYKPAQLRKMLKGQGVVGGGVVGGKALPRNKLKQRMNEYY